MKRTLAPRARVIVIGVALTVAYAAIATITALQAFVAQSPIGPPTRLGTILLNHYLAILPWIPATALIAMHLPRALRNHSALTAILWLGVATVGVINLVQAALLTAFGSFHEVAWLDQYAYGLLDAGHFGFLWYVVVVLVAYFVTGRVPKPSQGIPPPSPREFTVEVGSGDARILLRAEEIDWIEARGDYVRVHAHGQSYLKLERMKVLEDLLGPLQFARVHRSAIVNLGRVREFRPLRRGDYLLTLASGDELRLARSRRREVLARLRAEAPAE